MILTALAAEPGGTSVVVGLLGVGGLSAIAAAIATGLFSKRKLGAEATEIITNAAAGVVTSMQAQLDRSDRNRREDQVAHEAKMTELTHDHALQMTRMAEAHVKERREWTRVLQLHVAWDALAISKLAELELEMPPTPPLQPAERFVDEHGYPIKGVD